MAETVLDKGVNRIPIIVNQPGSGNEPVSSNVESRIVFEIAYCFSIFCAILSFSLLFQSHDNITQHQAFHNELDIDSVIYFRQSCVSTIILVIPTLIDFLLDISEIFTQYLLKKPNNSEIQPSLQSVIVRLTKFDLISHVIGIASLGLVCFLSIENSYHDMLYFCSFNFSNILVIIPILCFLEKNFIHTFTPTRVAVIIALTSLTSLASTITLFIGEMSSNLYLIPGILAALTTFAFILILSIESIKTVNGFIQVVKEQKEYNNFRSYIELIIRQIYESIIENYNQVAHVIIGLLFFILRSVWYLHDMINYSYSYWGLYNYLILTLSALLMVYNFRAKKSIVKQGLVSHKLFNKVQINLNSIIMLTTFQKLFLLCLFTSLEKVIMSIFIIMIIILFYRGYWTRKENSLGSFHMNSKLQLAQVRSRRKNELSVLAVCCLYI